MLQHARTSPRPRPAPAPSKAATAGKQEDRDSGMVDCPCGVTFDDGQAMIECERCKVPPQATFGLAAGLDCILMISYMVDHFHYT